MNKSRNFRRRAEGSDEDDGNAEEAPKPVISNNKKKDKHQSPSQSQKKPANRRPAASSNLLSFSEEAEDDEPTFSKNPKSKSAIRRQPRQNLLSFQEDANAEVAVSISKPKKKESANSGTGLGLGSTHSLVPARDRISAAPAAKNVQPQAGDYTKEKLEELKRNTKSLGGGSKQVSDGAVVVLKGLVKPAVSPEIGPKQSEIVIQEKDENEEEEEEEEEDGLQGDVGVIPDQATIDAIRAKRERLRQERSSVAPDYISLDSSASASGMVSRIGAERGGSSDDEAEIHGRFGMVGDSGKASEIARAGVFVEQGVEEEEDDEEKRWEEEQFRKGLGKRVVDDGAAMAAAGAAVGAFAVSAPVPPPPPPPAVTGAYHGYPGAGFAVPPVPSEANWVSGVTRSVEVMSLAQQAEVSTRALQESLQRLRESHGKTQADLHRADANLAESLTNILELEKSLDSAGEKYMFMQKLRDFIAVLCDFLQDKAPYIEELEEQMQRLRERRASAVVERRAIDDADEIAEIEGAVKEAMAVLNKGGTPAMVAAAAAAGQASAMAALEGSNSIPQLDEFGRDVNLQKRAELKRRAEARKQRRARAAAKRAASFAENGTYGNHIEGESSSDESDIDSKAYQSSRNELLQTAEQIFSDAAEEYSQLSVVKEKFETWKKLYSSAYSDAYMPLSAPAIFSPYVRLELLKWDPLYADADLNNMHWHTLLFDYGMPEDGSDFDPDDEDEKLIPELVEKVALPVLHHEVLHCWDRYSTRLSRNTVSAVQIILTYVKWNRKALQELLATVRMRLAEAVSELQVPSWSVPIMNAVSQASQIAAYRFGKSVRLLKNLVLWKDILATEVLEKLALDELLCRKMLPHLRNIVPNIHDAITRTERVVAALSGFCIGPNHTGDLSRKFSPLVDYIVTLGKELERKQAHGVSAQDISGLARRLKKMLVELNEYDRARRLLKTFQLKEAL